MSEKKNKNEKSLVLILANAINKANAIFPSADVATTTVSIYLLCANENESKYIHRETRQQSCDMKTDAKIDTNEKKFSVTASH